MKEYSIMGWPQSQDYNEAIQNAKTCFKDPELSKGAAVTNPLGMPLPCSGNFADVYQIHCPETKTRWAVKCFTRGDPKALEDRYAKIDQHLQQAKLPFAVGFRYLVEGIRVRKEWHPVLKMQWVEGFTLNHFVRDNLDKPNVLDALLQIWVRMGKRLREANMAHADLQHGNVMLVAGSTSASLAVKLIDYDGMWVPALEGKKSGEVGHPAYQHTKRLYEGTYSKEVDRFPLLVVATALRCLRVAGRPLWEKFDNGDNLLFREADLAAPERSPLFAELAKIQDAQAKKLVDTLLKATTEPLEDTPPVDLLLGDGAKKSSVAVKPPSSATLPQPEAAFADLGDPESSDTSAVRRKRRDEPAPSRKKWAMIGGGAAAALLAVVLVVALSGGGNKQEPDQPNNPIQADNRKDDKGTKSTTTTPRPTPSQLVVADLAELRLDPGMSRRFVIAIRGAEGDPSLTVQLQDLPQGVRGDRLSLDAQTGKSEWELVADANAPAGTKEVTVVANVGQRTARNKFTLFIPARTVTRPPEVIPDGPARLLGHFTTTETPLGVWCSPDGTRGLALTSKSLHVFNPSTGAQIGDTYTSPGTPYTGAGWRPDNKYVFLTSSRTLVTVEPLERRSFVAFERDDKNHKALAVSAEGRRLAVVADNGELQLYDRDPRRLLHALPNLTPNNHQMAFTRDGKRLLVSSPQPKPKRVLLDTDTGKEVFTLDGTQAVSPMLCVAITPDGKRGVFGYGDGLLELWDLENNKNAFGSGKRFTHHDSTVPTCAISADGRHVLVGHQDGLVRLLETSNGSEVRRFVGHTGALVAVALSPDGQRAVTAGADNAVRSWDLKLEGAPVPPTATVKGDRTLESTSSFLYSLAISSDGRKVYGLTGGSILLWDTESGKASVDYKENRLGLGAILPDGKAFITGANQAYVRDAGQAQLRALGPAPVPSFASAISSDGKRAIAGHGKPGVDAEGKPILKDGEQVWEDRMLKVWDLEGGKELHSLPLSDRPPERLAITADGKRAVGLCRQTTGQRRASLTVWDLVAGREVRSGVAVSLPAYIFGMALSGDGKLAALYLNDRTVAVWDLNADKLAASFGPFPETFSAIAISADGRYVLTGGGRATGPRVVTDCFVRLLDVASGKELRKEELTTIVRQVALSSDARWGVSVTLDHTIRLWDLSGVTKRGPQTGTSPTAGERLQPPSEKQRADALVNLKQVFADEYARAKPTDRVARLALADTLMVKAREIKDNPTDRFVLIREAADIYQQLAALAPLLAALDALAEEFAVERLALKEKAINDVAELTKASAGYKLLADSCLAVLDEAREAENFEAMSRLVALAESVASKSQDGPTQTRVKAAVKEARDIVKESEAAVQAETTLKTTPEDAAANLVRGKFLCFRIGAWQRGLPLLAKGEDEKLRELATKDTANPSSADDQVKLADAWFDVTKSMSGGKGEVLRRAAHWYGLALDSGLTALTKERAEKQLKAIEPQLPPSRALQAGGELSKMVYHRGPVMRLAYLPNGTGLVTASEKNRELKLWDVRSGKEEKTFRGSDRVNALAVSPDGTWIVWADRFNLDWTNVPGTQNNNNQGLGYKPLSVAYVGKTKRAVVGTQEGWLLLLEDAAGVWYNLDQKNVAGGLTAVAACTGAGGLALAGSDSGNLLLYSLQATARQIPLRLGVHKGAVLGVALLPDGSRAVSTGEDKTLRIWDVKQRSEVRRLVGHSGLVTSLSLSPDGRRLATSGEDGTVRVWDLTTFQELRRFVGHKGKVNWVTFSPDGRRLASAGEDSTIRIWGL